MEQGRTSTLFLNFNFCRPRLRCLLICGRFFLQVYLLVYQSTQFPRELSNQNIGSKMGRKKNKIIAKGQKSPVYGTQKTKRNDNRKRAEKFRDIVLRPESDDFEKGDEYIDSKTTKKILRAFEKQKTELQLSNVGTSASVNFSKPMVTFQQTAEDSDDSDLNLSDAGEETNEFEAFEKTFEMSKADEEAFMRFQKR